jgi:hypothetical protein
MRNKLTLGILFPVAAIACGQGPTSEGQEKVEVQTSGLSPQASNPALPEAPLDWVPAAGGHLLHPTCAHEIPSGARVDGHGVVGPDGKALHFEPCAYEPITYPRSPSPNASSQSVPGIAHAWLMSDGATSSTYLTHMKSTWTVPAAPTHSEAGETIIFFSSFTTPEANNTIIQPELRWTKSLGWFITAEQFTNAGRLCGRQDYQTTPISVKTGDTIVGTIDLSSVSSGLLYFHVKVADSTSGAAAEFLTVDEDCANGVQPWTQAQGGVLEVYNVTQCADLPGADIVFTHTFQESKSSAVPANSIPAQRTFTPVWSDSVIAPQPFGPNCPLSVANSTDGTGTSLSY